MQERLINAASDGNLEEMRQALKDGANADGTFDNSYPALEVAASEGRTDAVILLLDNGADVNKESDVTITPLGSAASYGHTDIVKILIENGADVCYESDGGTAQKLALSGGFKETAQILKESEARGCAGHYSPWRKYRLGTI